MKTKVETGRFLKGFIGLAAGALAVAGLASAETVVVTPSQMGSWSFATVNGNGDPCPACGSESMVTGPATPPIGVGSANLQTTPGNGDGGAKIDSSALNGISLGALTSLDYSTYDVTNNGQQFPYIKLYLTWNGGSDQIFFEPPYQTPASGNASLPTQGPTQMNDWQTWNALEGGWWDNGGKCGTGTGVCSLAEFASIVGVSLDDITITGGSTTPDGDGLSIRVGVASAGDNYDGYVDNVTIATAAGSTTYDFEPDAVTATPEPGTIALFGAGMLLLAGARRKNFLGRR
jgi:PEP-CTERM motif